MTCFVLKQIQKLIIIIIVDNLLAASGSKCIKRKCAKGFSDILEYFR